MLMETIQHPILSFRFRKILCAYLFILILSGMNNKMFAQNYLIGGTIYNPCGNQETVNANFNDPSGGLSNTLYKDYVLVTVSGTGNSLSTLINDAFYYDLPGNPTHDANYYQLVTTIDPSVSGNTNDNAYRKIVFDIISNSEVSPPYVPAFQSNNVYSFIINMNLLIPAPNGPSKLRVGVDDGIYGDNSGSYSVKLTQLCCRDPDADGICLENDNCRNNYNPSQADSDCDGVGDACDQCPGGDDRVDANGDGKPDCKYPPGEANVIAAWKCGGGTKVIVCTKTPSGGRQTVCTYYSAVQNHINKGGFLGPCNGSTCGNGLSAADTGFGANPLSESINQEFIEDSDNDFAVYPNPVQDELTIEFIYPVYSGKLQILNSQNQVVYKQSILHISDKINIRLSDLERTVHSGIYFVLFESNNQRIVRKFSVLK